MSGDPRKGDGPIRPQGFTSAEIARFLIELAAITVLPFLAFRYIAG